jgi:SPP1 gp7 family putative phage head morphogenesis protein
MSGRRRAEILARTETIRAHHLANIQEYRRWKIFDVKVLAEFLTAGDARVCPQCATLHGSIWTLDEIETMIPVHPQCRCIAIPFIDKSKSE